MMFRLETRHAMRALAVLGRSEGPMVLMELAGQSLVPAPMLAKILHRLARHGLVRGQPGPGGGYRLARPPGTILLREIVTAIEGPGFARDCLFGLPDCSEDLPCPLHPSWKEIRSKVLTLIDANTVADLASGRTCLVPAEAGTEEAVGAESAAVRRPGGSSRRPPAKPKPADSRRSTRA
jgi:Rrf2 family protein